MRTKTRHIYPTPDVPSLHAKSGRHPSEPVPLRWLESLVSSVLAAIPTESERNSAMVSGVEHLRVVYTDELTPAETMADELAELRAAMTKLRGLVRPDGTLAVSPEEAAKVISGV